MTNSVKIALVGAAGRMGKEIILAAAKNESAQIAAAIEYPQSPLLGKDAGEVAGVEPLGVAISSDLKTAAADCDVILDISLPQAAPGVIDAAVAMKKPLVCGITGIDEATIGMIKDAANEIPAIHTKNFSVGIAVLSSLAAKAAQILGAPYDIEIVETHHRRKIDAPSGTAQILADAINDTTGNDKKYVYGREGHTGERTTNEIGIHAIRGGGVFGEHEVIFASEHERLVLSHKAETRSLFAQGAVRTAVYMATAHVGLHTMSDVLGLE